MAKQKIESVFLALDGSKPHVFFIREGQRNASDWKDFYPTWKQLAGFVRRIGDLLHQKQVKAQLHTWGWVVTPTDVLHEAQQQEAP